MNRELLLRAKEAILAHPERAIMSEFSMDPEDVELEKVGDVGDDDIGDYAKHVDETEHCGTAFCIAGWICELAGADRRDDRTAARLLGVPTYELSDLFFDDEWPATAQDEWAAIDRLPKAQQRRVARAQLMAKQIDRVLERDAINA